MFELGIDNEEIYDGIGWWEDDGIVTCAGRDKINSWLIETNLDTVLVDPEEGYTWEGFQ